MLFYSDYVQKLNRSVPFIYALKRKKVLFYLTDIFITQ